MSQFHRLSVEEVYARLEPSVSLEFVRDSPMFRQQLGAFQDSFQGVDIFSKTVQNALCDVNEAVLSLSKSQRVLAYALQGRDKNGNRIEGLNSRCLFSNALPELGDMASLLHDTSKQLQATADEQKPFEDYLNNEMNHILQELSSLDNSSNSNSGGSSNNSDVTNATSYKFKKIEELCSDYENQLSNSLKSRTALSPQLQEQLLFVRKKYELARFDLVQSLNVQDSKKKMLLAKLISGIHNSMHGYLKGSCDVLASTSETVKSMHGKMDTMKGHVQEIEGLWMTVRARIEGELSGAMPPPGAPAGAMSPVQPRQHNGMPTYTLPIHTEVLRKNTRLASYDERRHAQDDGVYKQGFLFNFGGIFTSRKRQWYRLYHNKLYTMHFNSPSVDSTVVCDMTNAKVQVRIDKKTPHVFSIICAPDEKNPSTLSSLSITSVMRGKQGKTIELQADNEDEMVMWVQALRRCSNPLSRMQDPRVAPRRTSVNAQNIKSIRNDSKGNSNGNGDGNENEKTDDRKQTTVTQESSDPEVEKSDNHIQNKSENDNLALEVVSTGRAATLLHKVIAKHPCCGECNASPVTWISSSLGITLCESCATAHRQLTFAVSKLKSIRLDEFEVWQLELILDCLGNDVTNQVWEISLEATKGWKKPLPTASDEEKLRFILAKYRWFAFVDEFRVADEAQLSNGLSLTAREGQVPQCMWWLSHFAGVNSVSPLHSGITPLHAAVMNSHVHMCAFLALNGADLYAEDEGGLSPMDVAMGAAGEEGEKIREILHCVSTCRY